MRLFVVLAILVCQVAVPLGTAAELPEVRSLGPGMTSPPATLSQMSWLAGTWQGEGLGGTAEEVIAGAEGGQMMGMFRHLKADGSVNFYEFYVFAEVDGSIVLWLKHFGPDMVGWEKRDEYVTFPLVAIEGRTAYFDGITYALSGEDDLSVVVNVDGAGNVPFQYRRVP